MDSMDSTKDSTFTEIMRSELDEPHYPKQNSTCDNSLASTNIVIIGGGPTGLYAAALLAQGGVNNITIFERRSISLQGNIDLYKSYAFGLFSRGQRAVDRIEGLLDKLKKATPAPSGATIRIIDPEGKCIIRGPTELFDNLGIYCPPALLLYRHRFIQTLLNHVQEKCSDSINIIDFCQISNIEFHKNGSCNIQYQKKDGEMKEIESKFVMACDGANSTFVKYLQQQDRNKSVINSKYRFEYTKYISKTEGDLIRCMKFEQGSIHKQLPKFVPEDHTLNSWVLLSGTKHVSFVSPMMPEDNKAVGGYPVLMTLPKDDEIWSTRDVDRGFEIVQARLPQLDIRKCVTKESMHGFLNASYTVTPATKRLNSLSGTIGTQGGFVILGDAAHSMAPELGQGLNSALEDVSVLYDIILKNGATTANVVDIVNEYQEERENDIASLMKIIYVGGILEKRPLPIKAIRNISFILRIMLAKIFPSLFSFPAFISAFTGEKYELSWKNHKKTTTLILSLLAGLSLLLLFAMFLFRH